MPFKKIIDSVPAFYHSFLPQVFQLKIPPEPFSDCFKCPMIAGSRDELSQDLSKPFAPDTKCCTFTPRLPNYMAGAILSDYDPAMEEGKKRITEKIRSGEGIFPNGVYPTRKYNELYLEKSRMEFGRNNELLCPYFVEGKYNCTIWKYREAICALWFCKHLAGRRGTEFWNAVIDYIKFMQQSLINISAYRCGLQPVDPYGEGGYPEYIVPKSAEDADKLYSGIWKEWKGHEAEYYRRCYEIIVNMEHDYIQRILEKGDPLAKRIENIAADLAKVPEFMVLDKKYVRIDQDGFYQVEISNYIEILQKSVIWSFRLPKYILDSFDGRLRTSEVKQHICEFQKINVEQEILISLYRHGILKEKGT
jgi:hypothetical protein